ncbi:MAG: polymer-forming cytoskeletal protein [Anaerolineales bacterium]|jgi:cytoskeletal protein CcmA (bactofilin family)
MKTVMKIVSALVLAMLVFIPLQSAGASSGAFDGQVIFGQSFTLKSGDSLNGDLLVFGGSATIEKSATVNGSTVLFGGSLTVNGKVNGDVVVTGGAVTLGQGAHISGNLTTVAASLDRAEGSIVDGQIYNTATSWIGNGQSGNVPKPVIPVVPVIPALKFQFNPLLSVLNGLGQSLGIAILAMLLMLFLAPHADRIAHAILAQPLTAGGLGLLTVVVAPIAILLSIVTLILIPLAPIIVITLVAAGVFGWIAIGYEVGQRFTKAIHQNWHPAFSAGLGTFALTLVAKVLTGIPVLNCVGWLVPFLLSIAALGAVIMTRFGTQVVAAPAQQAVVVPTKPPEPTKPAE